MRSVRTEPHRAAFVLVLMFLAGAARGAGEAAEELAGPGPYAPPILHFENGGIGLLEAVRLTLEHDPNLLLSEEDLRLQEGVVQEASGAFDWTFSGDFSYQHDEQELRQSVVDREEDRRQQLRDVNRESCALADAEEQKISQLEAARQVDSGVRITADPVLDAQLQLVEELIAQATDPDERQALADTRIDIIDVELRVSRELAPAARQECIESAEDLGLLGETPELEEFDAVRLNLRGEKLFRSGLVFSPFLEGSFDSTRYVGKRNGFFVPRFDENGEQEVIFGVPQERFIDLGGKNVEDTYNVKVGFDANLPVLRGRGREAVAAAESAAQADLEGTAALVRHSAAQSILASTTAYWNLLAAQERLAILEGSVELQSRMVEITRTLIDNDQLPRAELARVLASEANARAQVDGAARELISARLALAQAIGLDVESAANAPLAAGAFPAPPEPAAIAELASAALADAAVERRDDVAATRTFVDSGRILARAAQVNLRSRLDVSAGLWATANGESSLSKTVDRWVVPSWSLGLLYEKPIGNHQRRGQLAQSEAQVRQRQISAVDLERNVRIAVVLTLGSLAEARDRLRRAEEAAAHFEETIAAELEKLKFGESTLVDSIVTEQQRTGSLLALVAARQEVAILLAQLRFETGTLFSAAEGEPIEVTLPALTTLSGLEPGS